MSGPSAVTPIDPDELLYVAGHRGLVGSSIWRALTERGHRRLLGLSSKELDLRDRSSVFDFFGSYRPRHVVIAAAKVGGIHANNTYPVEFLSDNLRIQTNVMDAALQHNVERLLFLGSSCIYPKFASQPISEDALMTGHLEPTNYAYAVAKIAGIAQVQAVRKEHKKPWISAMPTNLYGPGDNFSPTESHVIAALIRRYDDAIREGRDRVTNWGSGDVRREFLHVDDMASACLYLLDHYDEPQHVNIGTGADLTVREIAELIGTLCGYAGITEWDRSKPDGTPRKLLDISKLRDLGWTSSIPLQQGLVDTIAWYREHRHELAA